MTSKNIHHIFEEFEEKIIKRNPFYWKIKHLKLSYEDWRRTTQLWCILAAFRWWFVKKSYIVYTSCTFHIRKIQNKIYNIFIFGSRRRRSKLNYIWMLLMVTKKCCLRWGWCWWWWWWWLSLEHITLNKSRY